MKIWTVNRRGNIRNATSSQSGREDVIETFYPFLAETKFLPIQAFKFTTFFQHRRVAKIMDVPPPPHPFRMVISTDAETPCD